MVRQAKNMVPRYFWQTDMLRDDIRNNYRSGELYLSQNELMRRYKVSYCTVTRSLKELVAEGWIERRRGSGTYVRDLDGAHEPMPRKTTHVIGVFMPGFQTVMDYSPFLTDAAKYMLKYANQEGYCLQFLPERFLTGSKLKQLLVENRFDGVVFFNPNAVDPALLENVAAKWPTVFSEQVVLDCEQYAWIELDNVIGMELGMAHLLENRYRRIALIIGDRHKHPVYRRRLETYQRVLEENGIGFEPGLVFEARDFSRETGGKAIRKLLKQEPDSLFITSASFGLGAINQLLSNHRRIPQDIAVIGYDDQLYFSPAYQCLTTVEQPVQQHTRELVTLAIRLIRKEQPEKINYYLPPQLRQGTSVITRRD